MRNHCGGLVQTQQKVCNHLLLRSGFAVLIQSCSGFSCSLDQPFSINIAGAHRSKVLLVSGCNLASLSELYVFVVMASTQTCQNVMITAQAVVEPSSETPTSVLSFASYPRTGVLLPIPANNITLTSGLMVTHPIQWFAYNVTSSSASDADDDDEMVIMVQITNDHVTVDAWPNFIPSFLDDRGPSCTTIVEPGAGWPYILVGVSCCVEGHRLFMLVW